MTTYYQRALNDIWQNRFLNVVTIITIALSVLIVSAFALFFVNANNFMNSWKKGIRVMVYLKAGMTAQEIRALQQRITGMSGVEEIRYISSDEALATLKAQMRRQASLFANLKENPLPDTFEVRMLPSARDDLKIEALAVEIEALPAVAEVEYGQSWIGRLTSLVGLFRFTAIGMGALFFMASVFIVANTIRLVLYTRREEIEIMRLVGASDRFIKFPFYIQAIIVGALGGGIGIGTLFVAYASFYARFNTGLSVGMLPIGFLDPFICAGIVVSSMLVGLLGCFLSLKQFMKYQA